MIRKIEIERFSVIPFQKIFDFRIQIPGDLQRPGVLSALFFALNHEAGQRRPDLRIEA